MTALLISLKIFRVLNENWQQGQYTPELERQNEILGWSQGPRIRNQFHVSLLHEWEQVTSSSDLQHPQQVL